MTKFALVTELPLTPEEAFEGAGENAAALSLVLRSARFAQIARLDSGDAARFGKKERNARRRVDPAGSRPVSPASIGATTTS